IPFLACSMASGIVTIYAQKAFGALANTAQFSVETRISNASISYASYLAETIWPAGLSVHYPFPRTIPAWPATISTLVIIAISIVVLRLIRTRPYLAVGWFWYLVTMLPVIGLLQVGSHSRADRYTYIPLIGVFIMIAWGIHDLTKRWSFQRLAVITLTTVTM